MKKKKFLPTVFFAYVRQPIGPCLFFSNEKMYAHFCRHHNNEKKFTLEEQMRELVPFKKEHGLGIVWTTPQKLDKSCANMKTSKVQFSKKVFNRFEMKQSYVVNRKIWQLLLNGKFNRM